MIPSAVDTLWRHFAGRMATINANRKLAGVMDAQDWPPKDVVHEAFYMLNLAANPMPGKSFGSIAIPTYEHTLQFTWVIKGTEASTASNLEGHNRGDRYRTNSAMRRELVQALYPQFALKQQFPDEATLNNVADYNPSVIDPPDPMWWTPAAFQTRADRESGRIYGTATIRLVSMEEEILV